jgi:hypothetical protein
VNDADIAQVDVIWRGRGDQRRLETGCQAALAATGSRAFGGLPRYRLYAYPYRQPATVALFELGVPNPLGSLFGDEFIESRQVFAVRTNQGRYALVQATEVEDDSVLLGFKTYETTQAAVQIVGGFQCERAARIPRDAAITFRPQGTKSDGTPERETAGRPTVVTTRPGTLPPRATASDVAAASRLRAGVERPTTPLRGTRVLYVEKFHTGNWVAEYALPQKAYARLSAVATGVQGEVQYLWKVGGQPLKDGTSDRLTVSGQQVSYTVSGSELLLRVDSRAEIELYVEVSLVDDKGCATSAAFCAKHGGKCTHGQRYIPTWTEFRALHALSDAIARKGPLPLRTIQQGS